MIPIFFVRHSLNCSLMRIERLPEQNSGCTHECNVNHILECNVVYYGCLWGKEQKWSRGHKARGQGQAQKKSEAKDSLSEDRHSRGQGQECSRPRLRTKDTIASALQKKKVFTKIFQAI